MSGAPALIIFLGGFGESEAERLVDDARLAATLDAIDSWRRGTRGQVILVTDRDIDAGAAVTVDRDAQPFHFGRRLVEVLTRHGLEAAVYMGAGSVPLFGPEDFADVAVRTLNQGPVANNVFSSDLVGFRVTDAVLGAIASVSRDNSLARAIRESAAVGVEPLPRTVASQFDIDTPADLCVLAATRAGGPRLRAHIEANDLDPSRCLKVLPMLLDADSEILVAGRVGSHAWAYLERETVCRVRLYAEERGMEADGRVAAGSVRSLLGFYADAVGIAPMFAALQKLGDAAFIDSRVLLAHKRIAATREDRFLSDLGRWPEVRDPWLHELTRAAAEAAIPVLLGGHSLMAGGLMALTQHAWTEHDTGRL